MKFRFDNDSIANDFFQDVRLIGIISSQQDYQFCWQVQQFLQIDFRVNHELEVCLARKGRNYYFSVYHFNEPLGSLVHYLYNNQYDGEYLLPEFRHFDFIWLLKGDVVKDQFVTELVRGIKTLHQVQLVSEIGSDKVKHKSHLVF